MDKRKKLKDRRQKILTATPNIIRALFKNVKGNEASLNFIREGQQQGILQKCDLSFTYGEVVSTSFMQILGFVANSNNLNNFDAMDPACGRVFYDLGCGTGRAVICAALSHEFAKVVGIELVPELVSIATNVKDCLVKACEDLSGDVIEASSTLEVKRKYGITPLSHGELIEIIRNIISCRASSPEAFCSQQVICNELTKQLGSKLYRLSIQPFRKFSKFIESNEGRFAVSGDDEVRNVTVDCAKEQHTIVEAVIKGDHAEESSRVADGSDGDNGDLEFGSIDNNCIHCAENSNDGENAVDAAATMSHSNNSYDVDLNDEESIRSVVSIIRDKKTPGVLEALTPLPEIEFVLGDIFKYRWYDDADVAYAASLLFSNEMMRQLTDQALMMKQGAWIISLKPLLLTASESLSKLVLREKSFHKMSWQMAEVFIYQIIA